MDLDKRIEGTQTKKYVKIEAVSFHCLKRDNNKATNSYTKIKYLFFSTYMMLHTLFLLNNIPVRPYKNNSKQKNRDFIGERIKSPTTPQ